MTHPLLCALCHQEIRWTRHGLIHISDRAKLHNHKPMLEETATEAAETVEG